MNKEFICGSKQATFGGVVITCGDEFQCDACCRRERDALAAQVELLTQAAMQGGANKAIRDAVDNGPVVCLDQIKSKAIGRAMELIDMENFKMNGSVDPVVLRYMGELSRQADNMVKGE